MTRLMRTCLPGGICMIQLLYNISWRQKEGLYDLYDLCDLHRDLSEVLKYFKNKLTGIGQSDMRGAGTRWKTQTGRNRRNVWDRQNAHQRVQALLLSLLTDEMIICFFAPRTDALWITAAAPFQSVVMRSIVVSLTSGDVPVLFTTDGINYL